MGRKEVWEKVWESVQDEHGGCGEVCWGVGEVKGDVGEVLEVWREVREMWGVRKYGGRCGRVYGVTIKGVGSVLGCGGRWRERYGGVWGKVREMWGCGQVWGKVCWGFPYLHSHFSISFFTSP